MPDLTTPKARPNPPPEAAGPPVGALLREAATAIAEARERLPDAAPRLEAELLLELAAGIPRTGQIAWPERRVEPAAAAHFRALLARRLAGEPLAYIRGTQPFWDFELAVGPACLIPRPETELLVETALTLGGDRPGLTVVDLGTGSGAVAVAVARERPHWRVLGLEHAADTAALAQRNCQRLSPDNCRILRGDWLRALADRSLDGILANPPYIAEGDPHLTRGDLPREPRTALASGPDGLDALRAIARDAPRCLRPGGWIALEHGLDQGAAVRALLDAAGLQGTETRRDLAGHERVTLARARG